MGNLASFRKKARKQARSGVEHAREYFDELKAETGPGREHLARELRRQSPKLAAFALATAFEMLRSYRPRRRRFSSAVKLAVAAGAAVLLVRALTARR